MPRHDFSKPVTFIDAVEALSFALNCALVRLRDHANHQDDADLAPLAAAEMLSSMLEDAHQEVSTLVVRLERRVAGME